jgi:protein-L-isoaspartate(D-aspartate) O-methyltransferase
MERNDKFKLKLRLLLSLINNGYLKDKRLLKAFLEEKLTDYIPRRHAFNARIYEDMPNLFYFDRRNPENLRTISAPHMISIMLQGLVLSENDELLILGAKSGYIAALAHKLSPKGKVVILEANSKIAKITERNLKKQNYQNIEVIVKNPLDGLVERSPWQKILVTGAIKQERIYPLLRQLDPKAGVLFAPIGEDIIQTYTQILRADNNFYGKKQLQVRFTPLITEVELDDLELITDFDELELCEDSFAPTENMSHLDCKKIAITYASEILDDIALEPFDKFESLKIDLNDVAVVFLEFIDQTIETLKGEENIKYGNNGIDNIETQIRVLKNHNKDLKLDLNEIQNILNHISFTDKKTQDLDKLRQKVKSELKRIRKS